MTIIIVMMLTEVGKNLIEHQNNLALVKTIEGSISEYTYHCYI